MAAWGSVVTTALHIISAYLRPPPKSLILVKNLEDSVNVAEDEIYFLCSFSLNVTLKISEQMIACPCHTTGDELWLCCFAFFKYSNLVWVLTFNSCHLVIATQLLGFVVLWRIFGMVNPLPYTLAYVI